MMDSEGTRSTGEKKTWRRRLAGIGMALVILCVVVSMLYHNAQVLYMEPLSARSEVPSDEIVALYQSGREAMEKGDYPRAIGDLRGISGFLDAEERYAQSVEDYSAEVMGEVDAYLRDGEFAEALQLLKKAKTVLKDDGAMVDDRVAAVEQQYTTDVFARVELLIQEDQYDEALSILNVLRKNVAANEIVRIKIDDITEAYHQHFLMLAQKALEEKDFTGALTLLDEAVEKTEASKALEAARDGTIAAYKADFLARYDAQYKAEAYDKAIAIMEEAEAAFPEDTQFPARQKEAEEAQARAEEAARATPIPTLRPTPQPTQRAAIVGVGGTATPEFTVRPTNTPTSVPRPTSTPTATPKPTAIPTQKPTPTPEPEKRGTASVIVQKTYIRKTTELNGDVLQVARKGDQFQVLGIMEDHWYKVETEGGETGYIHAKSIAYCTCEGGTNAMGTATVQPAKAYIRQACDFDSLVIRTARQGEAYPVVCVSEEWIQVLLDDGQVGFLRPSVVTYTRK